MDNNLVNNSWETEFDRQVTRQHITGAWVAVVLDPLWFVSDYFIIPEWWKTFLIIRILVASLTLTGILLRKKFNLKNATIIFIPFLGIALQNAFMYSVMDVETLHKHTFAYIALFIGAGMFVIWRPVYSIVIISITLIGNIILFSMFSHLTLQEALINGGLLTATVAIFSILLTSVRYHSVKKEVISKLQLEASNMQILEQKNFIEKSIAETEKINTKLNRFAHVVSHDLKAPLRSISSLAEWLKEDLGDETSRETATCLTLMQTRIEKMNNLINGILEYSKSTESNLLTEEIVMNELLVEVCRSFNLKPGDRIDILPGLPKICQNRTRIIQVFQNLIGNAIKYNDKEKAEIKVYSIENIESYEFTVEDNGPGIAPEHQEKVFELFHVISKNNSNDSTGVGLSIVKKIIEECGGKIWIESLPGQGAAFKFTLPKISKQLNTSPAIKNYSVNSSSING